MKRLLTRMEIEAVLETARRGRTEELWQNPKACWVSSTIKKIRIWTYFWSMKMGQRVIVQFLSVLDLESLQFVENGDLWALICTVLIKDLTVNGKKKRGGGTSKIRFQRSLLESSYTRKNVNKRFEVGREIFTLTNIHIHNIWLRWGSQKQNSEWALNNKMCHRK